MPYRCDEDSLPSGIEATRKRSRALWQGRALRSCTCASSRGSSGGIEIELAVAGRALLRRIHSAQADDSAGSSRQSSMRVSHIRGRRRAALRHCGAYRNCSGRAGLGKGTRVLPERVALPKPSARDRLRRSRLYVPGTEPKYFINAALHGSDGDHSRSRRLGASRGKRCRAHPGAQCAAGGGFLAVRAHGAHQPAAARTRRSG